MRPFTAILLASWCYSVAAQVYPSCQSGFTWAFNTLNQSPCEVASALGEACTGLTFPIPALTPTQNYLGPQPAAANQCRCSSVFYSVLSACAVCQDAQVSNWPFYSQNCSTVSIAVFSPAIPSGIAIPHYAYLDPTANGVDTFNPQLAQADVGPDSTAIPQPTSPSASPTVPVTHNNKKSNTGAIAGGVVGGVVVILLLVGLIFFLRRRKPAVKSSEPFDSDKLVTENPLNNNAPTVSGTPAPAKYYDPNDPTTYPAMNSGSFVPSLYSSPSPPAQNQNFPPNALAANYTGATNYSGMGVPQHNAPHHPGQAGYTGTAEVM